MLYSVGLVSGEGDCRRRTEKHYFLRGRKRSVSFFQKKSGYALAWVSWPARSLPSSWGSTINTSACCLLTAGGAFVPGVMQVCEVARMDGDRSQFRLLLTKRLRRHFLSLQAAVQGQALVSKNWGNRYNADALDGNYFWKSNRSSVTKCSIFVG